MFKPAVPLSVATDFLSYGAARGLEPDASIAMQGGTMALADLTGMAFASEVYVIEILLDGTQESPGHFD